MAKTLLCIVAFAALVIQDFAASHHQSPAFMRVRSPRVGRTGKVGLLSSHRLRLRGGESDPPPADDCEDVKLESSRVPLSERKGENGVVDLRELPKHKQERFRQSADQGMDISGDGGVSKRIVTKGRGMGKPVDGDYVYVHYRGFVLSDGREFDDSRRSEQLLGRPFGFALGRGEVMHAWEIAVRTMEQGEVAEVWVENKYTWSDDGLRLKGLEPYTAINCGRGVPEDADVKFLLELVEFGHGRAATQDGLVRVRVEDSGVEGIWQRRANQTAGDEVEVKMTVRHRGRECFATAGFVAARMGVGELPAGVETALHKYLGVNGTATVRMWGKWAACATWEKDWLSNQTLNSNRTLEAGESLHARSTIVVGSAWNATAVALREAETEPFNRPDDYLEVKVQLRDWSDFHFIGAQKEVRIKCVGVQDRMWRLKPYDGNTVPIRRPELDSSQSEDGTTVEAWHFSGSVYEDDVGDGDVLHLAIEGSVVGSGAAFISVGETLYEIGDGRMPVGLELAIAKLKIRQEGLVSIAAGEYQVDGFGRKLSEVWPGVVGSEASVQFRVVVKAIKEHPWDKSCMEKLRMANVRKKQGNRLLSLNATQAAIAKYNDAFRLVEYEDTDDPKEFLNPETLEMEKVSAAMLMELVDLKAMLKLNIATAHQRRGSLKEGIAECSEAIQLRPKLAKAHYKRSVLHLAMGNTQDAQKDIMVAKSLSPGSASVTRQLADVQERIRQHKERERATWGSIFAPKRSR